MTREILKENGWDFQQEWVNGIVYTCRRIEEEGLQYWYNKSYITSLRLKVFFSSSYYSEQYNNTVGFKLFEEEDVLVHIIRVFDSEDFEIAVKVKNIEELNQVLKFNMLDFVVNKR